jgi:hypothetical protein
MGHTQDLWPCLPTHWFFVKIVDMPYTKSNGTKGSTCGTKGALVWPGWNWAYTGTFTFWNDASSWHIFNLRSVKFGIGNPWFGHKMGCLVLWNACLIIMFYSSDILQNFELRFAILVFTPMPNWPHVDSFRKPSQYLKIAKWSTSPSLLSPSFCQPI